MSRGIDHCVINLQPDVINPCRDDTSELRQREIGEPICEMLTDPNGPCLACLQPPDKTPASYVSPFKRRQVATWCVNMRLSQIFRNRRATLSSKDMSATQIVETRTQTTPTRTEIIAEKPTQIWHFDSAVMSQTPPEKQNVLLLHGAKQEYAHTEEAPVPEIQSENEVLLQTTVIGLNPIDWKGPAFGFGLPDLPCISGRELVGKIVKAGKNESRLKSGDVVLAISTDYRDNRKGAFQEYAIAWGFNAARIPQHFDMNSVAPIGVGFVTAALSLGICLGVDFSTQQSPSGPDLLSIARALPEQDLPEDTRDETFRHIKQAERPKKGDWIAIWGASSTTGFIAMQLAKRAGLRVACIVDAVKHGEQLVEAGADVLIHRKDTEEAVSILRAVTGNNLRFGLDAVGKDTAALLQSGMRAGEQADGLRSHLCGLTGVPKEGRDGVQLHKVPIKLFHEIPEVGKAVVSWLEGLLQARELEPPKTLIREGGLKGVNDALQHLRSGDFKAQRIVVPV